MVDESGVEIVKFKIVSDFKLQISNDLKSQISDFRFQISDFRFQISDFKDQILEPHNHEA